MGANKRVFRAQEATRSSDEIKVLSANSGALGTTPWVLVGTDVNLFDNDYNVSIGTPTPYAKLHVKSKETGIATLRVDGFPGQLSSLISARDSTGYRVFSVNPDRTVDISGALGMTSNTDEVQLEIHADPSQSANVTEWRDGSSAYGALMTAIAKNGAWKPATLADGDAENGTVYYSTTASKLVFKDSGGTVNNLY